MPFKPLSALARLLDHRRAWLALALFCALAWAPGFFTIPPIDRDESRFAQASKQMLESGDFVRIRNGQEARNRKPIGIHWLQVPFAAAAHAAGIATENPIWPYRIPSMLGAALAMLALYRLGPAIVGRRAAVLAGAMLAGSVILSVEVGMAKTDAALLGATTVAMGVLARAYLAPQSVSARLAALFWLALGAGILIKGPITPMVAGLATVALLIADRSVRGAGWLARLRPAWGVPLLLAVVLPWFVAIGVETGGQFFHDAVGRELGSKLAGGDDGHGGPPGLHLLMLPLLLFPSSLVVLQALPTLWRGRTDPPTRFLLAWLLPAWLVFEAVPTKLPHYTLPLYPALCLLGARWVLDPARPAAPRWLARAATIAFAISAAILAGAALILPAVADAEPDWDDLLGLPALAAAGLLVWLVLRAARVQDWPRATVLGLAAAPLLLWSIEEFELPHIPALFIAPRVQAMLAAHWPGGWPAPDAFAAVDYQEPSLMFLAGTGTQWLPDGAAGAAFLAAGGPAGGPAGGKGDRILLVGARNLPIFLQTAARIGLAPHPIGTVAGFNYSRGRREALTLFANR